MRALLLAAMILNSSFASAAKPTTDCKKLLPTASGKQNELETQSFIAYLSELVHEHILEINDLHQMVIRIKKDSVLPNPLFSRQTTPAELIHRQGIQEYIDSGKLNLNTVTEWLLNTTSVQNNIKINRDDVRRDASASYEKMKFHRLSIKIEVSTKKYYELEMMDTHVTQGQWLEVMGELKSHHRTGDLESTVVKISNRIININPNHPIERITWWSALEFANRLSIRDNLKPVYDLEKVKMKGEASLGTLEPTVVFSEGTRPFAEFSAQINDPEQIANSEGYRIPSKRELLSFYAEMRKADLFSQQTPTYEQLMDYFWVHENSDSITHAVKSLKPIRIGGKDFFDMFGNVYFFSTEQNPEGSVRIFGSSIRPTQRNQYEAFKIAIEEGTLYNGVVPSVGKSDVIGIRLVRTVAMPKDNH